VAHGFVGVRMVEQVKMVQPAELSSALGRERDMTAVGAHTVRAARRVSEAGRLVEHPTRPWCHEVDVTEALWESAFGAVWRVSVA
jgi:hypothetical protein